MAKEIEFKHKANTIEEIEQALKEGYEFIELDVKRINNKICTTAGTPLKEAVKLKAKFIIDIKEEDIEKEIIEIIPKDSIVISFFHKVIKKINWFKKGILFVGNPLDIVRMAKETEAKYLFVGHRYLTQEIINTAHKNNLKVFTWGLETNPIWNPGVDGFSKEEKNLQVMACPKCNKEMTQTNKGRD